MVENNINKTNSFLDILMPKKLNNDYIWIIVQKWNTFVNVEIRLEQVLIIFKGVIDVWNVKMRKQLNTFVV